MILSRRNLIRPFAVVLALFVIGQMTTGCTYLKELIGLGFQQPKVTLSSVTVTDVSMRKIDLEVSVRVDNPNGFDIELSKLVYKVTVADLEVAQGTRPNLLTIKEESHGYVKLPVTIDTDNAAKIVKSFLKGKTDLFCVVKATADFHSSVGAISLDFEDKKALDQI